jgi:hypothetical protein
MPKYFEKRSGTIWGVLTITLFLFSFGGFDIVYKISRYKFDDSFIFIALILTFLAVIYLGLIVWNITNYKKSQ